MPLRFEQFVALVPSTVFDFFANPAHLESLMFDWPQFRILAREPQVTLGGKIWFEVTLAGCVPVALGFKNTIYEPPHRFGGELIHGPFESFEHVLEFRPTDGGTIVTDTLQVRLPWVYGGAFAMRRIAAPILEAAFESRRRALERMVSDGSLERHAVRAVNQ